MDEIWKDIVGYEGKYAVSNWGKVKSLNYNHTGKEKLLSPVKTEKGYLFVNLRREGSRKTYKVHRLVLMTFAPCENMENLQVNHIDEDKSNNRLENLEWCTCSYNNTYNGRHKRVAEKKSIPIVQLSLDGKYIRSYKSSHDAEREGSFDHSAINKCCKNKFNREGNNIYKGFRWMYLSEFLDKNCGIIE